MDARKRLAQQPVGVRIFAIRLASMNGDAIRPGTIIILNGTTSAGKTGILRVLQEIMAEPYLDAGIDKFIFMLPGRYLNFPLWNDVLGHASHAGAMGHRLFSGMHHSIAALARAGNNVVADHVFVEPRWVDECAQLLTDLPAYLVGVRCPLDVTEAREKQRGDRTLGQARKQFPLVHQHGVYDFEVDTSLYSSEQCAHRVKGFVEAAQPARALRQLRK